MNFDAHKNLVISTVATAPSPASSGTSLTVATGDGATFPAAPFNCTVWPAATNATAANSEIVRVTNITGDVLTIIRTQEGSSARSIIIGDQIAVTITAKVITDIETVAAAAITAVNISAGAASNNLSAITFSNSNGVTFGLNASTITASVQTNYQTPGAYLTTADLSQNSSKYAGINGAITGGSITVNTSGVSVNLPAYLTTAMASNAVTLSNIKVSAGTLSANRSDITFSNGSGVSFGLDTNGVITATVKTDYQTSGNYLTTAMQSNAATISNIKISAGTLSANRSDVTFSNANNVTFGLDTNGVVTASVVPPSGAAINVSAGTTSTLAGAFTFNNSNGVSFGLGTGANAGIITATVQTNYLTTAMLSNAATISNIKVSAGTLSANRSDITFSDSNGVSWGLNTNGVVTATVATNYQSAGAYLTTAALSTQTLAFSLSGNTATTNSSQILNGGYALAGGNNVTLQQSNNTVSISVGNYITTGALSSQTLAFSLSGNSATTNSSQILNGGYALAGGNNVTLQQSNNTISIAVGNYITTADLSQNSSKYAGINSGATNCSVTVNTSGVSVNVSAINGVGVSNTGNTVGNVGYLTASNYALAGSGSITLSQSTAAGAATCWIQHPAWLTTAALSQNTSNYAGINSAITGGSLTVNTSGVSVRLSAIEGLGVSNAGNTAGNVGYSTGVDFCLAGSGSITLSQSTAANSITMWVQHPAWLTTAALSQNTSNYAGINGAIIGGSITVNTSGVSVNLPAYLTTAMLSNAATISNINISAGTTSANLSAVTFSNLNGVSFGLSNSVVTAMAMDMQFNYGFHMAL